MKTFLIYLLSLCLALPLAGQDRDERKLYILAECMVHANINGADIHQEVGNQAYLQSTFTTGLTIGGGIRLKRPGGFIYFQPGLGIRIDPQQLHLSGDASETIYKFTNIYLSLKPTIGCTFPVAPNHYLDFGLGMNLLFSLHNESVDPSLSYQPYIDEVTGSELNYVAGYRHFSWGDSRRNKDLFFVPAVPNGLIQLGYVNHTLLKDRRPLRLAVEVSGQLGRRKEEGAGNRGLYTTLDKDRNIRTTEIFSDRYHYVGLSCSFAF